MDAQLQAEIEQATKDGWTLCCGCYLGYAERCLGCPIETRKRMGLPPKDKTALPPCGWR